MAYRLNPFTGGLDIVGLGAGLIGVEQLDADTGIATPVAGVINILGGNGIDTVGDNGNTITINSFFQFLKITLTNSEIKNLVATPVEVIPAAGVGKMIFINRVTYKLNAGSEALTDPGGFFLLRFTDNSGDNVTEGMDMTGFIEQAVDMYKSEGPTQIATSLHTATEAENANIVITNFAGPDIAGNPSNDATLSLGIQYVVLDL